MSQKRIERPELFFCLVGPVGIDLDVVHNALADQLRLFGYDSEAIHITELLPTIDPSLSKPFPTLYDRYDKLITRSNELRALFGNNALMAQLAFLLIQGARHKRTGSHQKPAHGTAYIIRQLKRPEEINLLRQVYGKQVFQVSAYADPDIRKTRLATKMRIYDSSSTRTSEFEGKALELVNRDENEANVIHGQRLRDVFPLADVFIDATSSDSARTTLERFLKLVFGNNFHSPSREEYGMYMAKSASLRSVDLSRQVGAAVFNPRGEVKVLGCNEVPSPSGGTYWEGDEGDAREYKFGIDTNEEFKHRLLSDVLKKLAAVGVVNKKYATVQAREFLDQIKKEKNVDLDKQLLMMDTIEYGRIIHAEMNAITDAARKGIPLEDSTLYCTTFPCHLCAKHIISSGIKRVVYIEPYPKSYASELYREDIELRRSEGKAIPPGKVYFEPFIGIAPFRYRDLFEKSKRKGPDGRAMEWQFGKPLPIVSITSEDYPNLETAILQTLVQEFAKNQVLLPGSLVSRLEGEPSAYSSSSDQETGPT